jgi:lipoprotein NlpD
MRVKIVKIYPHSPTMLATITPVRQAARPERLRWLLLCLLLGLLAGCGRMLPVGGRDALIKYTVSPGDTLYSISWRHGYDHREVAAWNQIRPPYSIYPGQQLLLITPHQMAVKPASPVASAPTAPPTTATRPGSAPPRPTAPVPAVVSKPQGTPSPRSVEKPPVSHQQRGIAWLWPTEGVIVAGFEPASGKKGVDIRGQLGQGVVAAADGNVVYSGSGLIGYGNLLIIKHDDAYLSAYGHNRRLLVKEGAQVKQGEKIAEMGDSGKEGIILHFEIRRDGKPVNPLTYLPKRRY